MSNQFNYHQQSAEQLMNINLSVESSETLILRHFLIKKLLEINQLHKKYIKQTQQLHKLESINISHRDLDQQFIHHNMIINRLEQSIETLHSLNVSL